MKMRINKKRKNILIFFGPPASGKGTQAEKMGRKLKLPVLSIGELLREECRGKTSIGKKIENIVSSGKLVSNKIIIKIVDKNLKNKKNINGFILDGFPRNTNQLKYLKNKFSMIMEKGDSIFCFFIKISSQEVIKRISGRRICKCGKLYHLIYNPPKIKNICDQCGRKIFARADDNPKVIRNRLKIYNKMTKPVINYFNINNCLFLINGEQSINKVAKDIWNLYKNIL